MIRVIRRKGLNNRLRAIFRPAVIHRNHFPMSIGLLANRLQCLAYVLPHFKTGNDDAD